MKILIGALVAIVLAGPVWAQQEQPQPQQSGSVTSFKEGCEFGACATKLNGCKPLKGNTTSERYDAIVSR